MPTIAYINKRLGAESLRTVEQALEIIAEYQRQGYSLTLRQLYYQFVSRDLIHNAQRDYKRLGDIISDGRLIGLIDWRAIVDRTRSERSNSHWNSPGEILESAAASFALDWWETQERRVWVLIEKDALVGVIEGACSELDVPYMSCRGYVSQSTIWALAQRIARHARDGQRPLVLHLGDHDPSGLDMTRDIQDRLELFTGDAVEVQRLALNRDQIDAYRPPPNPAKVTDSRAKDYIAKHGRESWELDALEPAVISALIRDAVMAVIDEDAMDAVRARQAQHVETLQRLAREHRND